MVMVRGGRSTSYTVIASSDASSAGLRITGSNAVPGEKQTDLSAVLGSALLGHMSLKKSAAAHAT